MVNQEEIREEAQKEAYDIVDNYCRVKRQERLSRDDQASWKHMLEIYPVDTTNISSIEKALDSLEEKGYTVAIDKDKSNNVYLNIMMASDAYDRLVEEHEEN